MVVLLSGTRLLMAQTTNTAGQVGVFNSLTQSFDEEQRKEAEKIQREMNYAILNQNPELAPYFNPETGVFDEKKFNQDLPEMYKAEFMKAMTQLDNVYKKLIEEKEKTNEGPMRIVIPKDSGVPNKPVTLDSSGPGVPMEQIYAWYVDGVKTKEGLGEKTLSTTTPDKIGVSKKIELEVRPAPFSKSKQTYKTSVDLRPADIDLHYEGINYVPPEYKGKKMAAEGGYVLIEATPYFMSDIPGEYLMPGLINFTWMGAPTDASGLGKFSLVVPANQAGQVIVDAEDVVHKTKIQKSIYVRPVKAEVSVSKVDLKKTVIMGNERKEIVMKKTPLDVYFTNGGETLELRAQPYFFSVENTGELDMRWDVEQFTAEGMKKFNTRDPNKSGVDLDQNIFILRIPDKNRFPGGMISTVLLSVRNKNYPDQYMESSVSVRLVDEGESL
jgi:hypothetical protein